MLHTLSPTLARAAAFMDGYNGSDIEDVVKRCARNAWNRAQDSAAARADIASCMAAETGSSQSGQPAGGAQSVSGGGGPIRIVEHDLLLAISQVPSRAAQCMHASIVFAVSVMQRRAVRCGARSCCAVHGRKNLCRGGQVLTYKTT